MFVCLFDGVLVRVLKSYKSGTPIIIIINKISKTIRNNNNNVDIASHIITPWIMAVPQLRSLTYNMYCLYLPMHMLPDGLWGKKQAKWCKEAKPSAG